MDSPLKPSETARQHVEDLIRREKTNGLTPAETTELDQLLEIEHVMRLAKARARNQPGSQSSP